MKKSFVSTLTLGSVLTISSVAFAADGETLYKTKACAACHAIDAKMVGPAYTEVTEKYAGQDDAVSTLVDSILHGSKDKWGPIPMPPNAAVTEEEAKTLAEWILEQ